MRTRLFFPQGQVNTPDITTEECLLLHVSGNKLNMKKGTFLLSNFFWPLHPSVRIKPEEKGKNKKNNNFFFLSSQVKNL